MISVEDTEKKAAWEAEEAANQPDPLTENLKAVRRQRARYLKAFDIYKSNVSYGVETETEEQKAEVLAWYSALLDITELVTAESVPDFPRPRRAWRGICKQVMSCYPNRSKKQPWLPGQRS